MTKISTKRKATFVKNVNKGKLPMKNVNVHSSGAIQRFPVGDCVEVGFTEDGFVGSWFTGSVIEVNKDKRLVEFDDLLEDDKSGKLREMIALRKVCDGEILKGDRLQALSASMRKRKVSLSKLRPSPPLQSKSELMVLTKGAEVECFIEDGWWEGKLQENMNTRKNRHISKIKKPEDLVKVQLMVDGKMSMVNVELVRIGQEWDEETGLWNMRGYASGSGKHSTIDPKPSK